MMNVSVIRTSWETNSTIKPELQNRSSTGSNSAPVLTITQRNLFNYPPFSLTFCIQVTVQLQATLPSVLIIMRTWKVREVKSVENVIELCHGFSDKLE